MDNSSRLAKVEAKLDRIIDDLGVGRCQNHKWRASAIGPDGAPSLYNCLACPATKKPEHLEASDG